MGGAILAASAWPFVAAKNWARADRCLKKFRPAIAVRAKARQSDEVMSRICLGPPQIIWGAVAGFIFGCGPNVQMIYEGNVRFEHCYRLDLDPTIAPTHRRACWQDWLARHTYAQSGDRLSHAQQRLLALDKGDQATLSLDIDAGPQGQPAADGVPMPSSIHAAPPPKAIEAVPAPSQAPSSATKTARAPPEAECSDGCRARWSECSSGCESQDKQTSSEIASAKPPMGVSVPTSQKNIKDACNNCRKTFKACMHRCFK